MRIATAARARDSVELSLAESMDSLTVDMLTPAVSAGQARLRVVRRPHARAGWGTNTWVVHFRRDVPAGCALRLRLAYVHRGDAAANVFHVGREVAFGSGINTAWYPEIEREPVRSDGALRGLRGTGVLTFIVPSGARVHAQGRMSRRVTAAGRAIYRFDMSTPVFFAFGIGRYATSARPGAIPVTAFLLRRRPSVEQTLAGAQRILDVLSREFTPYPHREFALVEVPTDIADRAGFAGASMEGFILAASSFLDQPFNAAFYGHEIGHQWWPYLLGPSGREASFLLTDGMAQYASLRAVEALDGAGAAERYRRTGYPGYYPELSAAGYLRLMAAGLDVPLAQMDPNRQITRTLTNSKGMLVWDMLARTVGREPFRDALHRLFVTHPYERFTLQQFEDTLQRYTSTDLRWFFRQWLERGGAPDIDLAWTQRADTVRVAVRQVDSIPYRFMLDVRMLGSGCPSVTQRIEVPAATETTFDLAAGCRLDSIEADPDYEVLRWTPEMRSDASALVPYTRARALADEGQVATAVVAYREALEDRGEADPYGLRFLLHFGYAQLLTDQGTYEQARSQIDSALSSRPRPLEVLPQAHYQRAIIASKIGDLSTLRRAVADAVASDAALAHPTGAGAQARALLIAAGKRH